MIKRKRLYLDIEVTPNLGVFWSSGYKLNINYDSIVEERKIICICYQWEGEKVESLEWTKGKCDKKMIARFVKVMDQADELIGHNLDRFDVPWIRTRAFAHRIPMRHDYTTVDTLKYARRYFKFNSNRLDYISKFSGSEGKIHTDYKMWKLITLKNDRESLDKMVKYCKGDITELRKVFTELKQYLPSKTHFGVKYGGLKRDCPECGGPSVISMTKVSAQGTKKHQMKCKNCGKMHTVAALKSIK